MKNGIRRIHSRGKNFTLMKADAKYFANSHPKTAKSDYWKCSDINTQSLKFCYRSLNE